MLTLEQARANRLTIDWNGYEPPVPDFLGMRLVQTPGSARASRAVAGAPPAASSRINRRPGRVIRPLRSRSRRWWITSIGRRFSMLGNCAGVIRRFSMIPSLVQQATRAVCRCAEVAPRIAAESC